MHEIKQYSTSVLASSRDYVFSRARHTHAELSMGSVDPRVGLGRGSEKFPQINRC